MARTYSNSLVCGVNHSLNSGNVGMSKASSITFESFDPLNLVAQATRLVSGVKQLSVEQEMAARIAGNSKNLQLSFALRYCAMNSTVIRCCNKSYRTNRGFCRICLPFRRGMHTV